MLEPPDMGLCRRRSGLQLSLRGVGGVQGLWLAATLFALYALTVPSVLAVPRRRAGSAGQSRAGDETYRLPGEAQPLHYDITLTPHFEPAFSFDGTVDIAIQVCAPMLGPETYRIRYAHWWPQGQNEVPEQCCTIVPDADELPVRRRSRTRTLSPSTPTD